MSLSNLLKPKPIAIATLIFLSFLVCYRLFRPGYFSMQDDMHIFRLQQFYQCLQDGQIPCRSITDGGLGYGYPLFNYYGSLPYLIASGFHLFGFSLISSIKLIFILGFFLSAFGMFYLAQKFYGLSGSLLSAAFYLLAPYRAVDSYVRGALAEFFALALAPWVFWALISFFQTKKPSYRLLVIFFLSGVLLTHNLTALVLIPLLLLFSLIFYRQQIFRLLSIFASSLALSAFFILPAFFEKHLVTVHTMTQGYFQYINHFVSLFQLFLDRQWGFGASLWGPQDDMSFQIGVVHWSISLVSVLAFFLIKPKQNKNKLLILFSVATSLIFLFLTHSRSTFIWQSFPILAYFQFPWRFLGWVIFFLALIAGNIFTSFRHLSSQRILLSLLLLLLIIFNQPYFKEDIWFSRLADEEKLNPQNLLAQSGAGLKDYWPIFSKTYPETFAPDTPTATTGNATFTNFTKRSNFLSFTASVSTPVSQVTIPLAYFPNWTAYVNTKLQPVSYTELGLMTLSLPQGENQVELHLLNTPLRSVSNLISLIALIIILIYFCRRLNHSAAFWLIVVFAFIVRFANLSSYPVALNWDEVSHGYTAYSLSQTGHDQWGHPWPVFNFRAYGDYPTTLNAYLTIPFITLFGLNEFSVRLPSALLGFFAVLVSYFFGLKIFKSKTQALLLMFLVTISPWTFFPSRAVFQSTIALFFLLSAVTAFLWAFDHPRFLPLSAFLFGLSLFA